MDALEIFGFSTVCLSLLCYAFEEKNPRWFTLGFAISCLMGSYYGFKKEAMPFGIIEIFWTVLAFKKFVRLSVAKRRLRVVKNERAPSERLRSVAC